MMNITQNIPVSSGRKRLKPSSTNSWSLIYIVSNSNSPVVITRVFNILRDMLENDVLLSCNIQVTIRNDFYTVILNLVLWQIKWRSANMPMPLKCSYTHSYLWLIGCVIYLLDIAVDHIKTHYRQWTKYTCHIAQNSGGDELWWIIHYKVSTRKNLANLQ